MPRRRALFLDTVVLSNFALARQVGLLLDRYPDSLCTTVQVLEELLAGVQAGYGQLESVVGPIRRSVIPAVAVPLARLDTYRDLRRTLGAGESSVIVVAHASRGTVATDDLAARQACARLAVKVTGTIGILLAAVRDGQIPLSKAERALSDMVDQGFYSPVRCLADALKIKPPL